MPAVMSIDQLPQDFLFLAKKKIDLHASLPRLIAPLSLCFAAAPATPSSVGSRNLWILNRFPRSHSPRAVTVSPKSCGRTNNHLRQMCRRVPPPRACATSQNDSHAATPSPSTPDFAPVKSPSVEELHNGPETEEPKSESLTFITEESDPVSTDASPNRTPLEPMQQNISVIEQWRLAVKGVLTYLWSAFKSAVAPGGFLWGVAAGLALSALLVFYPFDNSAENALREKVTLFDYILQDINAGYVDKVDINKMFETGVNGMLSTLDPYTQFENNAEASEMHLKTSGKYGGVGLGISSSDSLDSKRTAKSSKSIVVVSAFEGYAFDAGVRPGDIINTVAGKPADGLSIAAVTDLLRGEPGTSVEITVLREGSSNPIPFTLMRRNIQLRDVPVATFVGPKSNPIGYIRLQSFAKDAASEVTGAFEKLMTQAKAVSPNLGLRGVVLDLRGNPGGLLNAAIEVSETILPRGSVVVSTKGRDDGPGPVYVSNKDPVLPPDVPIAVLVNGQTASASEIVAGAVQDLDRGIIVGTRTFGKGLVQNVQELPYRTALKFTVGRYFTPSGRCIQALKYNEKDANGRYEAKAVDESERKEFLTRKGRIVRDGGGIEPDVIAKRRTSYLENALVRQNMFFHFASRYAAMTKQETLPADFEVNDAIYKDFVRYVTNSQFKYESKFDDAFDQLEEMFSEVGYDSARVKVDDLRRVTETEMKSDFLRYERDIRTQLESALRFRFQPESERLVAELKNDDQLREAVRLLQSPLEYSEMLLPKTAIASVISFNSVASN